MSVHTADAATTDSPGAGVNLAAEEDTEGFSLMTALKQVGVILVIPVTLGAMAYGARSLRGEPVKKKRKVEGRSSQTPRPKSRPTMAPPPSRTRSGSAMKQVGRLKRK